MDKTFDTNYIDTSHHFYFTIENPSDDNVTFAFKVRNFINTTEYMNTTLIDRGPDPSQCLEEEDEKDESSESSDNDEDTITNSENITDKLLKP